MKVAKTNPMKKTLLRKFCPLSLALLALSTPLALRADEAPATAAPPSTSTPALPAAPEDSAGNVRTATEAYNAGLAALNKNELATAAAQFQKAVDLSPNDAGALMFLGYVKLRQEQYPDALTALEAARAQGTRLDAKLLPILHNNLGIAYANSNRPDDALAAYQKAIDLSKDEYVDARYNLAFAFLGQRKYKEALPHLTKLRDQRASDKVFQSSVYDGLAEAYENGGDWGNALSAYKKVTDLNPSDPSARFNFALALSKTGRVDDALTQGKEVLKLRPNHQPTLLLLGDLYSRKGSWKEAKDVLNRYVKGDTQNFTAWFTLGVAHDYTADFPNALEAYSKAEALSPTDPAVKNNIGRILFKRGEKDASKYAEAEQNLQAALKLDPNFDDARVNLALVYTAQSKWDDAIAQWKVYLDNLRATMQKPGLSAGEKTDLKKRAQSARGALAENYLKAGAYANAVKEYRALLADTPDNLDAMSNLGLALYHTKDYVAAISTYREVIKRDSKNAIAYNNLGVVLEASGKRTDAVDSYRKALALKPDYAEAKVNVERLTTAT
jgi:tetratricopeptide (TPR) repeat protein